VPVGVLRQQRGRREHHERAGRVLDEHVAVRQPPVEQAVRVFAVEADVAILPAPEQASLWNDRREEVERCDERRSPDGDAQVRRATRR
jgi:hypothetical protein